MYAREPVFIDCVSVFDFSFDVFNELIKLMFSGICGVFMITVLDGSGRTVGWTLSNVASG